MLFRSAFLFIVILLLLGVRSAEADPANIRILQRLLVWTGYYPGPIDGELGPRTIGAVRQLQLDHGESATGVPSERVLSVLIEKARQRRDEVDFRYGIEPLTGVSIGLPNRVVRKYGIGNHGALFKSSDAQVELQTLKISTVEQTLDSLFLRLRGRLGRTILYETRKRDWFVLTGLDIELGQSKRFYVRIHSDDSELRGFSISYPDYLHRRLENVVAVMSLDFDPFPSFASSAPPPRAQGGPAEPMPDRYSVFQGTAFAVASDLFLTNAHNVERCRAILLGEYGEAQLFKSSDQLDLALLKAAQGAVPIPIASDNAQLGEEVFALGYPLQDILQNGLNLTTGVVSSLKGLGGDNNVLQMSVPVHPGNSGGPLIDRYGRVAGVVTAKLSPKVALKGGLVPEGISFAVNAQAVRTFLLGKTTGMPILRSGEFSQLIPVLPRGNAERKIADITKEVSKAVTPVFCVRERPESVPAE